ncbi:MAG TPA: PAS-domain containing protein [Rhizomicrobium sp.]
MNKGKRRSLRATLLLVLLLLPQPAFAAEPTFVPVLISFGAVSLAVAGSLWAVWTDRSVRRLRQAVRALHARASAAVAARDALVEAGRESVVVWGKQAETQTYGDADALLDACLAGPDALSLSQALDDLGHSGAAFTLTAHSRAGEAVRVRGRAIGGFAAVWLEQERAPVEALADFRAVLDALPLPVWLRDRSLALTWANRAFAAAVGAPDSGTAVASQTPLEKSERDLASSARAEGHAVEAKRYVAIGGQRRALTLIDAPLPDGSIMGFAVDGTELSNVEARLQQHIDAYAETLDRLRTPVAIFGPDQRLSFYNRAFVALWGLQEDWLETHPSDGEILDRLREIRRLPEQRDYQTWKRAHLAAYERDRGAPPDDQWTLPDGRTLRVVAQPHPFGGLIWLYEDITEKFALEASYKTLTGVQRATLDTLNEGVAVFGTDGRLKLHNAAFARLWQFEHSDLEGQPHVQKIAEMCVQRFGEEAVWQKLVASVSSGSERRRDWGEIERFDRTIVAVSLAPLPDGATLVTFADVTDRFRIESALRERNEALEAGDRLKSDFVQHASFLFRDPLNAVQGFAEMLSAGHAGALNAKQSDYVQSILFASQRLGEITSDILDLAMIDSGNMRLELARVDLYDLLTRVAEPMRQHAASLHIDFTLDVKPDVGVAVLDQRRIRQVVFNLLSNALKYTPIGGAIALGAAIVGDDVQIYVSDSGPGIAADVQASVFERFTAKGRAGKRAGAGLGLALVSRFVELHDGWVELQTEEGKGTLVRCHLPRRLAPDSATPTDREKVQAA